MKIGPRGGARPKFYYVDPPLISYQDPTWRELITNVSELCELYLKLQTIIYHKNVTGNIILNMLSQTRLKYVALRFLAMFLWVSTFQNPLVHTDFTDLWKSR